MSRLSQFYFVNNEIKKSCFLLYQPLWRVYINIYILHDLVSNLGTYLSIWELVKNALCLQNLKKERNVSRSPPMAMLNLEIRKCSKCINFRQLAVAPVNFIFTCLTRFFSLKEQWTSSCNIHNIQHSTPYVCTYLVHCWCFVYNT